MLKDITLGQYLPGNYVVHRLDTRTKILLVIAYITALFLIKGWLGYLLVALFTFTVVYIAKIPVKMLLKSVKPLMFFVVFTALINLFMTDGRVLFQWGFLRITWEGITLTIMMALRLVFLVFRCV